MAAVGLYGVIFYSVRQRRHKMAIRQAVGATSGQVFRSILYEGLLMAAIGMVLGQIAALSR